MYRLFFDKRHEQKRWVIVFNVLMPSLFSFLGIFYAIKSYNISVDMKNNREQMDSLTVMIKELRQQNILLQKSVLTHENEFKLKSEELKYTNRPQLKVEDLLTGEISEVSNLWIRIHNIGGDISNFSYVLPKDLMINKDDFPRNRQLAKGNYFDIHIKNMSKPNYIIKFYLKDIQGNKYSQELICTKEELGGYVFSFGALIEENYTYKKL